MNAVGPFRAVDSHTEGMPTRVVLDGVGVVPGATMLERKAHFEQHMDGVRLLLMREPRGHAAMSGAILQPPTREDCAFGVLFIEVSGCLPMCGHGTIGVATVLVEEALVDVVEPETVIRLDVPAGVVEARVQVRDGRAQQVTLRHVTSFASGLDLTVELPSGETIAYDMAFGGNFYALVDAAGVGLRVEPDAAPALIARGGELMKAIAEAAPPVHPATPELSGCRHVVFHAPGREGADARSATVIHPGWIDRSPCGTGTSARMAALHARGALGLGDTFVNESIIGTRFTGRLVQDADPVGGLPAVVPEITGRAWVTGRGEYVLEPGDPFPHGFAL